MVWPVWKRAVLFLAMSDVAFAEDKRSAISLGIRMHDGRMNVLLARNTALPAKVSKTFTSGGAVEVFAGEHPVAKNNYRLGLLQLRTEGVSNGVRLSFEIDLTGLLIATVEVEHAGLLTTQTFENFRDIQNVLTSVESRGSWSMLTALADKSKACSQALAAQLHPPELAAEPQSPGTTFRWVCAVLLVLSVIGSAAKICGCRWRLCPGINLIFRVLLASLGGVADEELCLRLKATDASLADQMKIRENQRHIVEKLSMELRVARLLAAQQSEELEACSQLACDLPFIVYDDDNEHGRCHSKNARMRFVKIQCPGVKHQDIEIEIVLNGVVVKVVRAPSPGLSKLNWTKRFQFPQAGGHFDFQEGEVRLELGVLLLPFKSHMPQRRVFRLPQRQRAGLADEAEELEPPSPTISEGSAAWVLASPRSSGVPTEQPVLALSMFASPCSSSIPTEERVLALPQSFPNPSSARLEGGALSLAGTITGLQADSSAVVWQEPLGAQATFTLPLSSLPTESSYSGSAGHSSQDAASERTLLEVHDAEATSLEFKSLSPDNEM